MNVTVEVFPDHIVLQELMDGAVTEEVILAHTEKCTALSDVFLCPVCTILPVCLVYLACLVCPVCQIKIRLLETSKPMLKYFQHGPARIGRFLLTAAQAAECRSMQT